LEALLNLEDSYATTTENLDRMVAKAELIRGELLDSLFSTLRPVERSYRQLALFFENVSLDGRTAARSVDLFILNADTRSIQDRYSATVGALQEFVRVRNDNFNFRDDISNLIMPGFLRHDVREQLEDIANKWGMLLITDLDDENTFRNVERQFQAQGRYEYLKRAEDRAAADVVVAGYVRLRTRHSFENASPDDLYAPASLLLAAAIARTDESHGLGQGPVGSRLGKLVGVEKCRFELLIGEMEHLAIERQLIPIIRDADGKLCFFGARTLADDPYGYLKFFMSYRIIRFVERCCRYYLLQVAGQTLRGCAKITSQIGSNRIVPSRKYFATGEAE
jgi:hypothetical protein